MGTLTYDKRVSPNRIFYRDGAGLLAYYLVVGPDKYDYADFSHNHLLTAAGVVVSGPLMLSPASDAIYFTGRKAGLTGRYLMFAFVYTPSGWVLRSPSLDNTVPLSAQVGCDWHAATAVSHGATALSPNGITIVYFGHNRSVVCMLTRNTDGTYTYSSVPITPEDTGWRNSLQFRDGSTFYFVSTNPFRRKVCQYRYEELYCENNIIAEID